MTTLHRGLHHRINVFFVAALGPVLAMLNGGANGLAQLPPTFVRCVPNQNISSRCYPANYSTIQAAVNAASAGDTILVAPGTYNESVTISVGDLSLLGAQAGNDARLGRNNSSGESIVDATGKGNSAIIVEAEFVLIDGFTVQNGSQGNQAGVDLKGICSPGPCEYGGGPLPASNAVVVNNIIQNNGIGIAMDSEGYGGLSGVLIEHNLIRNNNAPSGDGIFTSIVKGTVITQNAFSNNQCSAMGINNASNVTINGNTSVADGSFVVFTGTTNSTFSQNQGRDFGAEGVLPGAGDAAVAVGPGNEFLVISDNDLADGMEPVSNGIAFTNVFGRGATNGYLTVKNNSITGFAGTGILAETYAGSGEVGTLDYSLILGNQVKDNGAGGIHIEFASPGGPYLVNGGNRVFDNVAEGNAGFDCRNDAGYSNVWINDTGNSSYPAELCSPPLPPMTFTPDH